MVVAALWLAAAHLALAQQQPPPVTTLRFAVLPNVFTSQDILAVQAHLLKTMNASVTLILETQPSGSELSVYFELLTDAYLASMLYDGYMVDMLWTSQIASAMVPVNASTVSGLCASDAPGANVTECDFTELFLAPFRYGDAYVAVPLYGDSAVLFLRDDVTGIVPVAPAPYGSYQELVGAATTIMDAELVGVADPAHTVFNGYLFAAAASEDLTEVALEWIYANGGGTLIDAHGRVTVNNPFALEALYNATTWMGGVAPETLTFKTNDVVASSFDACTAAYMRNVPQTLAAIGLECAGFPIITVTNLPVASTLGAWGLAVPAHTPNQALALEAVRFLTAAAMQATLTSRINVMPTRVSALATACGESGNLGSYQCTTNGTGQLVSPAVYIGDKYANVSLYFSEWVNEQLTTQPSYVALQANLALLAVNLNSILNAAGEGQFCGIVNSVQISCEPGLSCVNSACFNFTPLIYGLTIPVTCLLLSLVAYILLLHYRKAHGKLMQWSSYSIAWSDLKCDPKPVGRGTFGIVYHGRYRNTEVAIKRILNQDREAVVLKDFKAETKMLVSLRHPNIVLFMGACFDPANLAIVTEWMHKGSLHAVLHDPRITLDFSDRMRMLRDIACGMAFLHASNPPILHRDLKSPNILVDVDLRLKVSDFGLTVFKDAKPIKRRAEPSIVSEQATPFQGSLYWCAPEVMRNMPFNETCDVYSFGIVMWEVITREPLYPGLHPLAVGYKVMVENLRPTIPAACPDQLAVMMRQCWHEDQLVRPDFAKLHQTFESLANPYLSQFINNLKEVQEINQLAAQSALESPLNGSALLDMIGPEAESPLGSAALAMADVEDWDALWDSAAAPSMETAVRFYSNVLRQNMRKCRGYQVHLEGRSCIVAFSSVQMAARWALTTQADLLEVPWPAPLLDAGSMCKTEMVDGRVVFCGLRVRMSVHVGDVSASFNPLTKRHFYTGATVDHAAELCAVAQGGQVILSQDAVSGLRADIAALAELEPKLVPVEGGGRRELWQLSSSALDGRQFRRTRPPELAADALAPNLATQSLTPWSIPPEELVIEGDCLGYGSGTLGEVFRGSWRGAAVAIKRVYRTDYPTSMLVALSAEVAGLFRLRHPNILLFHGAAVAPDTFYLVYEFMDRGALRPLLLDAAHRPNLETRLRMAADVAVALAYMHGCHPPILHGNLRSTNIMVNASMQAKVSDFDLPSARQSSLSTVTLSPHQYWTAPEVIFGQSATTASDVYSFGIVLWELVACDIPFRQPGAAGAPAGGRNDGDDRLVDWIPLVLRGTRPFVPEGTPPWCDGLIQACWDGSPPRRPAFKAIANACLRRDLAALGTDFATLLPAPPLTPTGRSGGSDGSRRHGSLHALASADFFDRLGSSGGGGGVGDGTPSSPSNRGLASLRWSKHRPAALDPHATSSVLQGPPPAARPRHDSESDASSRVSATGAGEESPASRRGRPDAGRDATLAVASAESFAMSDLSSGTRSHESAEAAANGAAAAMAATDKVPDTRAPPTNGTKTKRKRPKKKASGRTSSEANLIGAPMVATM